MENLLRLIPDPLRSVDVNGRSLNEPIGQISSDTPTVVNKRKYATSSTSSLSLSSSASSSMPSSPASDAGRESSNPGIRSVLASPRLRQIAKRQRLDPGGGVTASSRQTLAPPPVYRRRPPTPFNRLPGETPVAGGGQVEDLSSDGSGWDYLMRLR